MDGLNEISPVAGTTGLTGKHNNAAKFTTLNARGVRLVRLLIDRPQGISRKEAEPLVGTPYAGNDFKRLRDGYGLQIPCKRVKCFDRDGHKSNYGIYSLAAESRPRALQLLGGAA